MTHLAAGAAVLGGVFGAQGALKSGKAAKKAAQYNAKITRKRGDAAATAIRRRGKEFAGKQASLYGSSGVQMKGSALDVLAETAANTELDALYTRYDAEATARLDERGGKHAKDSSKLKAGASLLSGASRGAGYYS